MDDSTTVVVEPVDVAKFAKRGREPGKIECDFIADVQYEFHNSTELHKVESAKYVFHAMYNRTADHASAESFARAVEAEAARFIEAVAPRYEVAVRAAPKLKGEFEAYWIGTLRDLIDGLRLVYDHLDWFDDGDHFGGLVSLSMIRLNDRLDYVVRGVASKPLPTWRERHPNLDRVLTATSGAVLALLVQAAAKAFGWT